MPDNLLQKLEEKMMMVISEVEELRKENQRLNHENVMLKSDRENHSKKLHELIALLDAAANLTDTIPHIGANLAAQKPVLIQGDEVYR